MPRLVTLALAFWCATAEWPHKPHVIFVLTDDLGWNTAWNNADIQSPTLNRMAAEGLKLTSHYSYRYCSPTRAALLVGRSPYKLLNIRDNLPDWEVTDLRFTMLPKRLREAGYYSYHIGKWHLGMRSASATPIGRGFQESYGFLGGSQDHFDSTTGYCKKFGKMVDAWAQGGEYPDEGAPIASCDVPLADREPCPLFEVMEKNGSAVAARQLCRKGLLANCAYDGADGAATPCYRCFVKKYNGFRWTDRAVHVIKRHAATRSSTPMFMYLALQNTHGPIQAPEECIQKYNFPLALQNTFDAMVSVVDSTVANVTEALRSTGMWSRTLLIWTTDNGSPVPVGGSNAPFRGTKGSAWEGGTRVPAFISGGVLPPAMAGKTLDGIVAMWDYFATFCALAGIDPAEPEPTSPSPVDSYDLWPYLSGQTAVSPRTEIVYDHLRFDRNCSACFNKGYVAAEPCDGAGAIRVGDLKLLVGTHGHAGHYGHFSPNASWTDDLQALVMCSIQKPCLFNVTADAAEQYDLADDVPDAVAQLLERYHAYDHEYHPPSDMAPSENAAACEAALNNGGFRRPWINDVTQTPRLAWV